MLQWKEKIIETLNRENIVSDLNSGIRKLKNVTGSIIIQNLFKTNNYLYSEYIIFYGLDNVYPVNYNLCVDEYIIKPYENYKNIEKEFQPIIVLVNSVYKYLENKTENEIIEGNTPISYFLNKSLKNNIK